MNEDYAKIISELNQAKNSIGELNFFVNELESVKDSLGEGYGFWEEKYLWKTTEGNMEITNKNRVDFVGSLADQVIYYLEGKINDKDYKLGLDPIFRYYYNDFVNEFNLLSNDYQSYVNKKLKFTGVN